MSRLESKPTVDIQIHGRRSLVIWNVGLHGAKDSHGRVFPRTVKVIVVLVSLGGCSFVVAQGGPKSGVFDRVSIGASDPEAWNGIVFDSSAYGQSLPFALRIGSKSGSFLDGVRIFDAVSEVGPHAPNGSYARVSWRHYPRASAVTLEWAQINATTVVGRIKAPSDIQLVLEAYSVSGGFPSGSFTGTYRISEDGTQIIGDHPIDGHFTTAAHMAVATDRPITG